MDLLDALADLALGAACPGCGTPARSVCAGCRTELSRPRIVRDLDGWPVLALTEYDGVGGRLMRRLKDGGAWGVASHCGPGLRRAVAGLVEGAPCVLVPVPSRPRAVRERGVDHTLALTRAASGPGVRPRQVLARRPDSLDQAGLATGERLRNQRGSMRATREGHGRLAVLVDDICTTGATLLEARRVLIGAGWECPGAAVVASTRRRRADPRRTGEFQMTSG